MIYLFTLVNNTNSVRVDPYYCIPESCLLIKLHNAKLIIPIIGGWSHFYLISLRIAKSMMIIVILAATEVEKKTI